MKSLEFLYSLIESLEKEEKRFFKLQTRSKVKREKKYLQLYEILEQAEKFHEDRLLDQIETFGIKDLHVKVPYLRDLIIKSLINQHAQKTIDGQLCMILDEARLMEQRGFMKRYKKMLEKAKRIAYRYERFPILLEILQKDVLYVFNHSKKLEKNIEALFTEIDIVKEKINELSEYQRILHSFFLSYRTSNRARNTESQNSLLLISKNPLLTIEKEPTTFWAKINYFFAKALIQRLVNKDLSLSRDNYLKVVTLWEAYPHMKAYDPKLYKIHLYNYLNSCHMLNEYDKFPSIIEKMRAIPAYTIKDEVENFQHIVYLELLFIMNNFEMGRANILIKEILAGLRQYKGKINNTRELSFMNNIAVLYFAMGNFDETTSYTQQIKGFRKIAGREDIHLFANIMYLMAFYEMNKNTARALDSTLVSAARSIKRKGGLYDFETIMLELFNLLAYAPDKRAKKELFKDTEKKLKKLEEDPKIAHIEGMSEVSIWLESKRTDLSFVEILQERTRQGKKR